MQIRCVVACTNASGSPDFYPVEVTCTKDQYDNGDHYDSAIEAAQEADYEGKMVVFDEKDGPKWLFQQFDWEKADKVEMA